MKKAPTAKAALSAAKRYAELTLRKKEIDMEIEQAIAEIKAKHASELDKIKANQVKDQETIEAFVTDNREELLPDKKSGQLGACKYGFKLKPAKVEYRPGKDEAKVLSAIKKLYPEEGLYKVKETIDKTAIKKKAEEIDLRKLGLQVTQEEVFFLELA